jgi:hypothetical protein
VAIDWNPTSPRKVGNEHVAAGYGHRTIDAPHDVGELQFEAKHTGPITHWELYAGAGASSGGLSGRYGELRRPVMVELVAAGNEDSSGATYTDFPVSSIVGSASMYNANLTKPLTTNQLATPNDGLFVVSSKLASFFEVNFATGAFALDRHVIAVEVRMRINLTTGVRRLDPTGEPWFYDVPEFSSQYILRTVRWGEAIVDGSASAWSHWTPTKVREFASTRKVRFSCQAGPGHWRMDWLQLRVHHLPERRIGVGFGMPAFPSSWVSFPMRNPADTAAPSVTNGQAYSLLARRITDYAPDVVGGQAVLPWRFLHGRAPENDWRLHNQPWASWADGFSPAGSQLDGIPVARALNAGSVVATAQPYVISSGVRVYDGQDARQRLTVPGGGTVYGQAYVMVGWVSGPARPQEPLALEVRRVSDGVVMFSSTSVTADEVNALPLQPYGTDREGERYRLVRFRFPESLALAAGSYELVFSSPGTSFERRWHVGALTATGHSADQTYGGTTQYASGLALLGREGTEVAPSGAYSADLMATLAEVPAAVTGVETSVGSFSAHDAEICSCSPDVDDGGSGGCASDPLPYVRVEWDAAPVTSPPTVGYLVARTDDWSPTWDYVAYVDGRTTTFWDDHEPRIGTGVENRYRVQVVQEDGVTGDWSAVVGQTIPAGQVALAFSSNAAQAMGCVYPEVWTGNDVTREWANGDAGDVSLRRFYGRDMPVAFRPLERAGDSFERTLLVSAGCLVASPSLDLYRPLRDLARAAVPYVCVRDGEGNRWYASLTVPDMANRRADDVGNELWLASIRVDEVSSIPYQVDTSVPQVTGPAGL